MQMRRRKDDDGQEGYAVPEDVPKDAIIYNYSRFKHNSRFFLALAPCVFVLIMFAGQALLGTAMAGLLVVYMLDFNGFKETTLAAIWLCVFASIVQLIVASMGLFRISLFNVALIYNMLLMCVAIGLWATLQFQFLQRQSPRLTLVLERLLFAIMPATPAVILTWSVIGMYGIENAAYYCLIFQCIANYLFCLPLRSSFCLARDETAKDDEDLSGNILGRFECAVHTCGVMLVPVMLHVGINHSHLFKTNFDISNIALLIALPMLYLFLFVPKGTLWWAGFDDKALAAVRKVMTCLLLLVVVTCLEVRVIFHAFSDYIHLQPPFNYIVVTLAVYSLAGIAICHYLQLISERASFALITASILGAIGVCFGIGLPFWIMPFAVIAAGYFSRFYFSSSLLDYVGFVCGSFVVVFWFVHKTFMFLDFEFNPLPMSMYHVSLVLMLIYLSTLLIPGLIVSCRNTDVNGALLSLHGLGIMMMEMLMYEQFTEFYPPYLVILTTAMGIALAFRLESKHKVSDMTGQLMASIYLAKLGILTHPTPYGVRSALLLAITCAPFSHHYWSHKTPVLVSRPKAYLHVIAILLAAILTRHTLLAAAMQAMLEHTASESSLFAMALLVWAVACFPFASAYFKNQMEFKRLLAAALGGACALLFVQPNMEWLGPWLSLHGLPHEADPTPAWPSWCAVIAVVLPLIGLSSPKFRPTMIRLPLACASGVCLGLFLVGSYVDVDAPSIYINFCISSALIAVFITFTIRPSVRSHEFLPYVFAGFVAGFPAMFMLDVGGGKGHNFSARRKQEDLEQLRTALLSVYSVFCVLIALIVKSKVASSVAVIQGAKHGAGTIKARGAMNTAINHSWLPTIGNISTCLGFVLALVLSLEYMQASESSVFFLAPILLLLSPDTGLFRWMTDKNRYFPIVSVTSGFLVAVALFNLLLRSTLESRRWMSPSVSAHPEAENMFTIIKNLALLAMTIPSHVLFNKYLWDFKRQSGMVWIALMPLNLVPIVLSDSPVIIILASLAILFGLAQLYIAHRIKEHGKQFL